MSKALAISALLFLAVVGNLFAQEMTLNDARRVRPSPPVGLSINCTGSGIDVFWRPYALQSVSRYGHYVVYRSRNGGRFVKIAVVKEFIHFIDKKGRKGDSYAVSAVNVFKVESPLSVAIKLQTSCKKKP